ncbi:MAG: hypothetical protein CMF41_01585 [Legionellales bacterium]|nr:hypothetical protein [Legionellales bacterium]OUX66149.1 MAG: hypothetical protein CBE41_00795 [Gammaproteobacteria bacterium TMED281]|tara:strand:+ start:922 stop:1239 length:318 start_codon:yes stop_codon:yes gene_type:complete
MENNLDFTKDSILNRLETRVGSIDPIHGSINLIITDFANFHISDETGANHVDCNDKEADCTISVDLDIFKNIINKETTGMVAFMQGQLKVEGDMSYAMKLGELLN